MHYLVITLFCLAINSLSTSSGTLNPISNFIESDSNTDDEIQFHLHTRDNPIKSFILEPYNDRSYINCPINYSDKTIIYIHGFAEEGSVSSAEEIRNAYLAKGSYNIITVSWTRLGTTPWYEDADKRVATVGSKTAKLIRWLTGKGVVAFANLHVIGFSLGVHVAAFISEDLAKSHSPQIRRITGLDPSGPGFALAKLSSHGLNKTHAEFVDIIHTNSLITDINNISGHVEFYINYGKLQSGCDIMDIECGHNRAWEYYVKSISSPNEFPGEKCTTWNPTASQCTKVPNVFLGYAVDDKTRGIYFVSTSSESIAIIAGSSTEAPGEYILYEFHSLDGSDDLDKRIRYST